MEDVNTAIRMIGHLLEHNGTTGSYARNKSSTPVGPTDKEASCFCFIGASKAIAWGNNGLVPYKNSYDLAKAAAIHLGWSAPNPYIWDSATDAQRLAWARKLQKIGL